MAKKGVQVPSLRSVEWKQHLHAPDAQLVDDLYEPALKCAVHYDRCCAYFSSSVLSAAARGFGGLVNNILQHENSIPRPAVRLLVNEELDPADLEALLATGDQSKLIDKLLKQFKTPKDALEKKRLEMLAWLVASGWLQVRVGLMRYTGGLLHAKYGIVRDAKGDCLTFMGSGNETGTGLVGNYEELRLYTSWKEKGDTDYYQQRFEELWEDRDENVTTIDLPLAVEQKLIKFSPKEPPSEEPRMDRDTMMASMLWRYLAAAPYLPNGEYASDATALVDMWAHQRTVVEDTSRSYPSGRLLCDEVGMGKTIEAILILRRLLSGRGVKRALLLVPAGLMKQWQDELREKGGVLVCRWEDGLLFQCDGSREKAELADAIAKNNVLLVSREWARLEANRNVILTAPKWDLVLMDEAHAARRSAPKEREFNTGNLLLELLRQLQLRRRTRGIMLLSATPMQTQPWEPWDLLSVLGVGGNWMVEFGDIRTYYDGVAQLLKQPLGMGTAKIIEDLISGDKEFPQPPQGIPQAAVRSLGKSLSFALSGERQQYANWLRHGVPLSRRMHRNTRDTLNEYHKQGLLPDYVPSVRQVEDVVFDYLQSAERDCYNAIKRYIDDRFERLEHEKGGKGFVMTVYRRRAASSPHALRRSLERRLDGCEKVIKNQWFGAWRVEDEQIDVRDISDADIEEKIDPALPTNPKDAAEEKEQILNLLGKLEALGNTDSKFDKFSDVLHEITKDGRSALVFTEYADTLEYLRDLLRPAYDTTLGCYSGAGGQIWDGKSWHTVSKADITEHLHRGDLKVLICTDAASEGLNLQSASALINYDLPWNPSKVEQRIGRIDRIGQDQSELPIRNLFLNQSVDMRVYQVLRERCGLFMQFVGRMQPVLAIARDALRRERFDVFLGEVEELVRSLDNDHAVVNTFIPSEAEKLANVEPLATRADVVRALGMLEIAKLPVSSKRIGGEKRWKLTGVGKKALEVSTDRETLERMDAVAPISLGTSLVDQIADKASLPGSRIPLVIAEVSSGAFKCMEARWVDGDKPTEVKSARQLQKLMEEWNGRPPSPSVVVTAQESARGSAMKRLKKMVEDADARENASIQNQLEACRTRLLRELGRTLRCTGTGDLGSLFDAQIKRETRADGRYHTAHKLLGEIPTWSANELKDIQDFVSGLTENGKYVRRTTGSEIDAALNDPRWLAQTGTST